jgi:hypothetical protein
MLLMLFILYMMYFNRNKNLISYNGEHIKQGDEGFLKIKCTSGVGHNDGTKQQIL